MILYFFSFREEIDPFHIVIERNLANQLKTSGQFHGINISVLNQVCLERWTWKDNQYYNLGGFSTELCICFLKDVMEDASLVLVLKLFHFFTV